MTITETLLALPPSLQIPIGSEGRSEAFWPRIEQNGTRANLLYTSGHHTVLLYEGIEDEEAWANALAYAREIAEKIQAEKLTVWPTHAQSVALPSCRAKALRYKSGERLWTHILAHTGESDSKYSLWESELPKIMPETATREGIDHLYPGVIHWDEVELVDLVILVPQEL